MSDSKPHGIDVEGAIIDADLLVKYRLVNRAIDTLQEAIRNAPRSIPLREKLREIYIDGSKLSDAAQICMDLSSLYVAADKLELANERLLEAKRLDPQVSITAKLNQLENTGKPTAPMTIPVTSATPKTITGDLADISIFDIVQVLESSRMTGTLTLTSADLSGKVFFNDGRVVDAVSGEKIGLDGFSELVDIASGQFEFEKSPIRFQQSIESTSNTQLILDVLRRKDEDRLGESSTPADELLFEE